MDDRESFQAAVPAESIAADREFIQGNPEPLNRLYSHADDTLPRIAGTLDDVSACGGPVAFAQFEVDPQHVDHLLAEQSVHRRIRVSLDDCVDLTANLR